MANPLYEEQIGIVDRVLAEIGAGEIPTLLVPNKIDLAADSAVRQLKSRDVLDVCPISALTGSGVNHLLTAVGRILDREKVEFRALFSPAQGDLIALLRERGRVIEEIYDGNIIRVTAMVTPKLAGQLHKLLESGRVTSDRLS
jgi:GTP-binding protein HflX